MKIVLQEPEITKLLVASLDRLAIKMDNKVVNVRYSQNPELNAEYNFKAELTIEDKEETDESAD